jgi:hypothetical protein
MFKVFVVLLFSFAVILTGLKPQTKALNLNFIPDRMPPNEKIIESVALQILCRTNGNFKVLDEFLKSKGYIVKENINQSDISDIGIMNVSQDNLPLTMRRYYYTPTNIPGLPPNPHGELIFLFFDWRDGSWEPNPGSYDSIELAWDPTAYELLGTSYYALTYNGYDANNKMWLTDENNSAIGYGLYEAGQYGGSYRWNVDHGAISINLVAIDSKYSTTTIWGKYLHTYNNGAASFTLGFRNVFNITFQKSNGVWPKAIYLRPGQDYNQN